MESDQTILRYLRSELSRRQKLNIRYSLRSYASFLQMPPGRLSEILNGKREISKRLSEKLYSRFGLSHLDFETEQSVNSKQITLEKFAIVSQWYHFAILSLMETKGFKSDPVWIANRLGISLIDAKAALERLKKAQLIELGKTGYRRLQNAVFTTSDVPSTTLRNSHKDSLLQVIETLDSVPVEWRDVTSITLAFNVDKMNEAKKMIKNFRRKLAKLVEDENSTEVYELNVQLVPLTRGLK